MGREDCLLLNAARRRSDTGLHSPTAQRAARVKRSTAWAH